MEPWETLIAFDLSQSMSKLLRRLFRSESCRRIIALQIKRPVPRYTPRPILSASRAFLHPSIAMPDIRPDNDDGVVAIQQPVENESEILRENTKRGKATLQTQAAPEASNESTANPPRKLSQADFKVYNGMAETMEYFVRESKPRCSYPTDMLTL